MLKAKGSPGGELSQEYGKRAQYSGWLIFKIKAQPGQILRFWNTPGCSEAVQTMKRYRAIEDEVGLRD